MFLQNVLNKFAVSRFLCVTTVSELAENLDATDCRCIAALTVQLLTC